MERDTVFALLLYHILIIILCLTTGFIFRTILVLKVSAQFGLKITPVSNLILGTASFAYSLIDLRHANENHTPKYEMQYSLA